MCVVGASGPGRGGKTTHSVEGFAQIAPASGGKRGMVTKKALSYPELHFVSM